MHHPRQDNTYHGLCYTSRGALAGTRNSSMGPPKRIDPTTKIIEAEFQTIGPLYQLPVCYLLQTVQEKILSHMILATYWKFTVTTVIIHTKCQLQYLHPPHISTSGKCHCVIIHQTTKATEYTG